MSRALATGLLCLLVAAGCGDEDEPASEAPTTTTTTTTTEPRATTAEQTDGEAEPGDEGDGAGQAEAEAGRPRSLEGTLEAVLTGSLSPALTCDELVTAGYVKTAYGAREGCLAAQRPGALVDSFELRRVDESGASASAIVIPAGGPYDGVEVEVELVREGGDWRVDSLLADVPAGP